MWQNDIIFTPTATDALMVLFFHGPETQKKGSYSCGICVLEFSCWGVLEILEDLYCIS